MATAKNIDFGDKTLDIEKSDLGNGIMKVCVTSTPKAATTSSTSTPIVPSTTSTTSVPVSMTKADFLNNITMENYNKLSRYDKTEITQDEFDKIKQVITDKANLDKIKGESSKAIQGGAKRRCRTNRKKAGKKKSLKKMTKKEIIKLIQAKN